MPPAQFLPLLLFARCSLIFFDQLGTTTPVLENAIVIVPSVEKFSRTPLIVTSELHSVPGADAKSARNLHSVDIRTEKDECPTRLLFLTPHHCLYLIRCIY